jgi:hypothetical protein
MEHILYAMALKAQGILTLGNSKMHMNNKVIFISDFLAGVLCAVLGIYLFGPYF